MILQHLPPNPLCGDQVAVEPLPDSPLAHPGLAANGCHPLDVVASQGAIDVSYRLGILNLPGIGGKPLPQTATDHLQMHWLDIQAQLLHCPLRALEAYAAQVVDQLPGCGIRKLHARLTGRSLHGQARSVLPQQLEPEGGTEPGRDWAQIGVEAGRVFLPHGEQSPPMPSAQRYAHLGEKRYFGRSVSGVDGQNLLELIKDQYRGFRYSWPRLPLIQVVG